MPMVRLMPVVFLAMASFFRENPVATNQTTALFYTTMGVLMAVFAGVFAWTTWPH